MSPTFLHKRPRCHDLTNHQDLCKMTPSPPKGLAPRTTNFLRDTRAPCWFPDCYQLAKTVATPAKVLILTNYRTMNLTVSNHCTIHLTVSNHSKKEEGLVRNCALSVRENRGDADTETASKVNDTLHWPCEITVETTFENLCVIRARQRRLRLHR